MNFLMTAADVKAYTFGTNDSKRSCDSEMRLKNQLITL